MDYDDVEALRGHHPAWRLLRADSAALVLSFLGRVFVDENVRSIPASDLAGLLDDELYELNQRLGADSYPRPAKAYLEEWAQPSSGWLRKYYPTGSQEPHFDATPDIEKALSWVNGLQARPFIGTESRLNTVFELLRQMSHGTEADPQLRLAELHRRRAELDAEIARVEDGDVQIMEPAGLRDRYQQFTSTARELLADFREVEANFRTLDRGLREKIAAWGGSKGELLDDVLASRSSISDSDQGRTFHAFYDFLLSQRRQEEFVELLTRVQQLPAIGVPEPRMRHIHHDWLAAGERTQGTVRLLSEQLRRFLDDKVWLENRRVIEILRGIETSALALRDRGPVEMIFEMEGASPTVALPMERPLYRPSAKAAVDSSAVDPGDVGFDSSALFEQVYVDRAELALGVRQALQGRDQVALTQLLLHRPVQQGLAEIVGYFSLEDPTFDVVFDQEVRERVSWVDPDGAPKAATVPAVTYVRTRSREVNP